MERSNINALINLLEDPDAEVSELVTENLRKLGTEIIPDLESAWESSPDSSYQEKIESIISEIQFINIKSNLENWRKYNRDNLLEGLCWIARYQYPDLDTREIKNKIDKIARDVWLELNSKLTALEKIRIINHILFKVHKFNRSTKNIYSPRNSYINQVLEMKAGNAVSLSALYILIAERLKIPVYGVNLPKIFLLAYIDEADASNILFYINPYAGGTVLGKKEIEKYLVQQKLKPQKSYFRPCSNEVIIERLLLNLAFSYEKAGFTNRVNDLKELIDIFSFD